MDLLAISLDVIVTPRGHVEAVWSPVPLIDSTSYFDWPDDQGILREDLRALAAAVVECGWVMELGPTTWSDGRPRWSRPTWLRSGGWSIWIGPGELLKAFAGRWDPLSGTVTEPDEAAASLTAHLHDRGWCIIIVSTPEGLEGAIPVWHPTCTHVRTPADILARRQLDPRTWEYSQGSLAELRLREAARRVRQSGVTSRRGREQNGERGGADVPPRSTDITPHMGAEIQAAVR